MMAHSIDTHSYQYQIKKKLFDLFFCFQSLKYIILIYLQEIEQGVQIRLGFCVSCSWIDLTN